MKSQPYLGIPQPIVDVTKMLIDGSDAYHRVHTARFARTATLLLENIGTSTKMLELGTSGFFPLLCQKLAPQLTVDVTHFDKSNQTQTNIDVSLGKKKINVNAFAVDLEFEKIPVDDKAYDIVLCCEVLEHMEVDPMFMLSEVNRVLKNDGLLILTTPNITSSRALKKILDGVEPYFYMQYHRDKSYNRHNYEYSAPSLAKILSAAGFKGKIWSEDLFEDGIPEIVKSLRDFGFKAEHVGDNLISVSRKHHAPTERYPNGIYA